MAYTISDYSFKQAKKLGVHIKPSRFNKYKIDIFDSNGDYMFSGGDNRYSDYPTYLQTHGKNYAEERRRLYRIRHQKELDDVDSKGYYIANILW